MKGKTPLGEKSVKFIVLESLVFFPSLIAALLCIIGYIKTAEIEFILLSILLMLILIFLGFILFATLVKPKIIIEYDNSGIYLNYSKKKTIYILIRDIESVISNIPQARLFTYSFGTLTIETKTKKYRIGIIKDVENVRRYIYSRIAYKYQRVK